MRTPRDVLRSMQRYVAVVLGEPELAEVEWTSPEVPNVVPEDVIPPITYRWSPGLVKDDLDVDLEVWRFLLTRRGKRDAREAGAVTVGQHVLGADPFAPAAAASLTLPSDLEDEELRVAATTVRDPSWDVRFWHERGDFKYPVAVVKAIAPARPVGNAIWSEVVQPMHVTAYLKPPLDAETAQLEAEAVRERLLDGFLSGVGLGRPYRVPLYDYDLVPDDETTDARDESDFLRVDDVSVELLPDPDDARQVAVVADVRVSWRRTARDRRGWRTLDEIRTTFGGG